MIRNTLGNKKILYDEEGEIIRGRYLEQLVTLQEDEGLHAVTKLRKRHLQWQKEKMKVKLATQTFSKSVADALTFCREDLKLPEFSGSAATSRFCIEINTMFDLLNSRNLLCKSDTKKCISVENVEEVREKVQKFCVYLEKLHDEKGPILQSQTKMGFLGMIICMKNAVALAETLFATEKMKFLMTYKLSQDHLETFFSAVRHCGEFNNNPSCKQFKAAYKKLLMYAEPKLSNSANITDIDGTNILSLPVAHAKRVSLTGTCSALENGIDNLMNNNTHTEFAKPDDDDGDDDLIFNAWFCSEYAIDVICYIAGFVARKLIRVIKCNFCSLALVGKTSKSKLQNRKTEGKLISAFQDLIEVCIVSEYVVRTYRNFFSETQLIPKMVALILSRIPQHVFGDVNHMLSKAALTDHRYQLLKAIAEKYCIIRLHHEGVCRQQAIERVRAMHTKLILFKHQ